jgi:hypothetical protein
VTLPEVLLVRSAGTRLGEATVLARAVKVTESSPGQVTVSWQSAFVLEDGDYLAVIRFPEGSVKQGPGRGAALRAMVATDPAGNFVAGSDGVLEAISVDLDVSLLTASGGAGKVGGGSLPLPDSQEPAYRRQDARRSCALTLRHGVGGVPRGSVCAHYSTASSH